MLPPPQQWRYGMWQRSRQKIQPSKIQVSTNSKLQCRRIVQSTGRVLRGQSNEAEPPMRSWLQQGQEIHDNMSSVLLVRFGGGLQGRPVTREVGLVRRTSASSFTQLSPDLATSPRRHVNGSGTYFCKPLATSVSDPQSRPWWPNEE